MSPGNACKGIPVGAQHAVSWVDAGSSIAGCVFFCGTLSTDNYLRGPVHGGANRHQSLQLLPRRLANRHLRRPHGRDGNRHRLRVRQGAAAAVAAAAAPIAPIAAAAAVAATVAAPAAVTSATAFTAAEAPATAAAVTAAAAAAAAAARFVRARRRPLRHRLAYLVVLHCSSCALFVCCVTADNAACVPRACSSYTSSSI
jgi:hypothetical protein